MNSAPLSVEAATAAILDGVVPLEAEAIGIEGAHGRVLAADVTARLTQPPFAAAAMDGYAVRAADVARLPARLRVVARVAAGHPFDGQVGKGEAARVFTGAAMPAGTDSVALQENATAEGDWVTIGEGSIDPQWVRPRGYDFTQGDVLLRAGRRMGPRELALAAAMGHGRVEVHRRPRVAVLSSGDELVMPGELPGPGQIVASNHLGIAAMLEQAGAAVGFLGIARDTRESLAERIAAASGADVLVTIGGASVGEHDLVAGVLGTAGMRLAFWKIAMRPGKPLLFGRLGAQRVIGLPGNPVSAMVCARLFAVPLVRTLVGMAASTDAASPARLTVPVEANGPRQHYMRATLGVAADGARLVTPLASQDSSLLASLAVADVFVVRPPHAPALTAGRDVPVLALDM